MRVGEKSPTDPMKNLVYSLGATLCLVLSGIHASAQYAQGQGDINLGIGFVSNYGLPISVSYDYGITDNISIGGIFSYASTSEDLGFGGMAYSWKYTYMIVGARGMYHFELMDNMDTYAGLLLGYNIASAEFDGDPALEAIVGNPSIGGVAWGLTAGTRYHFTEKFGAFAELGYGVSVINLGLTYKI